MRGQEVKFSDPALSAFFKKANFMQAKYKEKIQDLYKEYNVAIYEDLLR